MTQPGQSNTVPGRYVKEFEVYYNNGHRFALVWGICNGAPLIAGFSLAILAVTVKKGRTAWL